MAKQLTIHNSTGSSLGEIVLNDDVFGIEPNVHVMHLAVRRQLNNGRSGSANSKQEQKFAEAVKSLGNKKVLVELVQVV